MATQILDSAGAVFTITAAHQIAINGITEQPTSNVFLPLYWYQRVYQRNGSLDWYSYAGTPGAYTFEGHDAAGDPRNRPPGSFSQTLLNLDGSTQYGVQVLATNSHGTSDPSTPVAVRTTTA